ncbi:MAG: DUF3574 domain-containing protein [Stellaceae bacterium]
MAGFRTNLVAALSLTMLAGCAGCAASSTVPAPYACLLPGEQRMLVAELFFGRNIEGRAPLSDAEWAEFAAQTVTPSFPDGFTVLDGEGQWRNPRTGRIIRDPTKILLVAAKRTPDLAHRLSGVIDAYKARFHQQSVGLITRDTCADFD